MPASSARWAASLHRFGQAVLDDDAVDAKRDGLVDHVGLQRRVLTAVEHLQIRRQVRLGLAFHAVQIGLEEVAGGQVAHQRDLDLAGVVERCRHVLRRTPITGTNAVVARQAKRPEGSCW